MIVGLHERVEYLRMEASRGMEDSRGVEDSLGDECFREILEFLGMVDTLRILKVRAQA